MNTKIATRQHLFDAEGNENANLTVLGRKGISKKSLDSLPNSEFLGRSLNDVADMVYHGFPTSRLGELTSAKFTGGIEHIPMSLYQEAFHNKIDPTELIGIRERHNLQASSIKDGEKVSGDLPQYLRSRILGATASEAENAVKLLKTYAHPDTGIIPVKLFANHLQNGGTPSEFHAMVDAYHNLSDGKPEHFIKQYNSLRGLGQGHLDALTTSWDINSKNYSFPDLVRTVRSGGTIPEFMEAAEKLKNTRGYSIKRKRGMHHQISLAQETGNYDSL